MNQVLNERGSASRRPAPTDERRRRTIGLLGVSLFIVSESMFFLGLFLAWFFSRSYSDAWPPAGVMRPPLAPAVFNTIVVLLSTVAIVVADRSIARNDRRKFVAGIAVAAALGVVFMAVQAVEFADLSALAQGSAYGSTFTFLLIFHALRVFVGVTLMTVVLIRAALGQFNSYRRLMVQATAQYWYFITGVWLVVFMVLYLTP
jgi:heme/copper-type cytochrome/quinol oxidase subunit 3